MSQDQPPKPKSQPVNPKSSQKSETGGLFQGVIQRFRKPNPPNQPSVGSNPSLNQSADDNWDDDFDFIPTNENDDEISNWDDDDSTSVNVNSDRQVDLDQPISTNTNTPTLTIPPIDSLSQVDSVWEEPSIDVSNPPELTESTQIDSTAKSEIDWMLEEDSSPSSSSENPPTETTNSDWEEKPPVDLNQSSESTTSTTDWTIEANKSPIIHSEVPSTSLDDDDLDSIWEEPSIEVNKTSTPPPSPKTNIKTNIKTKLPNDHIPRNPFQNIWGVLLNNIRRLLPSGLNKSLSDPILTAILASLITMGIWLFNNLNQGIKTTNPVINTPISPPTVVNTNKSPIIPQISPEQALVNSIQGEIGKIIQNYPDDIIKTLEIDFDRSQLIVTLNNVWYLINDNKQDEIGDRMWHDARQYHFNRLELRDINDDFVARNPVVGQHMVISKRRITSNS